MSDLTTQPTLWQDVPVTEERTTTVTEPTTAQTNLYRKLVAEIVELAPQHEHLMSAALDQFVTLDKRAASARIDKALATLKDLKAQAPAPAPTPAPESFHVHPGVYTVVAPEGRRTFKVEVQASDAKFAPGSVIISYLAGADNDSDYTGFGFIVGSTVRPWKRYVGSTELLAFADRLMADPAAALVSKNCARCGRTLTTPESIASGFGPECVKKGLR